MKPLWLFDFDGVLADSVEVFEEAVKKALKLFGYDIIGSRGDFLGLLDTNLYRALTDKGVTPDDYYKCFAHIEATTDFSGIKLFEGMKEVVGQMGALGDIAIVSSNKASQIEKILEFNGAKCFFPLILGIEAGRSKVDKIKAGIEHFGAAKERTFYILDTIGDIEEAREAGVKTVAVGWGWHEKEKLLKRSPDHFVETPDDLARFCRTAIKSQI